MRVRINIGLDFDGNHTFEWTPSNDPHAVEVPKSTLERWNTEREAFTVAYLRWRRVMEEVEDALYRAPHAHPPFAEVIQVGAPAKKRAR